VRYAESDGWKADDYRPHAWQYRDYVVRAFNEDVSYADFVRQQLAGDQLSSDSAGNLAAVGFLRLGIYEYNQRNAKQHWKDIVDEITDVTGDVFLGMGMACARCHDHKFDPILRRDYYRLRAFFEPLLWRDDQVLTTRSQRVEFERQQQIWLDATREIREQIDAIQQPYMQRKADQTVDKFPLEIQAAYAVAAEQRSSWQQQMAYLVER
ncbi:MAG: DUF1549 domain-containing protein, partial [Planctomycetaceae bacterium]|nr:DUF1549 domain-containing protein [Planctomycetaceae bacterium]